MLSAGTHQRPFTASSTSCRAQQPLRARAVQARAARPTGAAAGDGADTDAAGPSRRALLSAAPALAAALCAPSSGLLLTPSVLARDAAQVSTYLPPAPGAAPGLFLFVPDSKKTPAIRAATVDPTNPYRFNIPGSWREAKVANIQSGNYCQPRCAEPWTEVIFENPAEGKLQVIVAPLVRLTNRKGVTLEDVGTPTGILTSLGAFITGTQPPEPEDVVSATTEKLEDGRAYYYYEVFAPYGTNGPHTLSACTVKGDLLLLFLVSANDKQWARTEQVLRQVVTSFRA